MVNDNITISGLKELDAALKQFPAKVEGAAMRGALRAGTGVFLRRARENLLSNGSVQSRALWRSLRISTKRERTGDVVATLIAGNAEAFYAHMVEFGTKSHIIKATNAAGKNVAAKVNRSARRRGNAEALAFGSVLAEQVRHPGARPKPFMRPALDGGERAAMEAMAVYLRKRLAKLQVKK